jgi:hypothetical protein
MRHRYAATKNHGRQTSKQLATFFFLHLSAPIFLPSTCNGFGFLVVLASACKGTRCAEWFRAAADFLPMQP